MTIDELKALAEKAKAWRPMETGPGPKAHLRDLATNVDAAFELFVDGMPGANGLLAAKAYADSAAAIAYYFANQDSTPVHAFAAAVREFVA
jgi:hypothetical protein